METHYYTCDRCGAKTSNEENIVKITRDYKYARHDLVDGEFEGWTHKHEEHHICTECWDKIKNVVLNK